MATNIPTNTPLQQQIDEFIAEGASWLPAGLLRDLLRPIGQLITSGAASQSLKEGYSYRYRYGPRTEQSTPAQVNAAWKSPASPALLV